MWPFRQRLSEFSEVDDEPPIPRFAPPPPFSARLSILFVISLQAIFPRRKALLSRSDPHKFRVSFCAFPLYEKLSMQAQFFCIIAATSSFLPRGPARLSGSFAMNPGPVSGPRVLSLWRTAPMDREAHGAVCQRRSRLPARPPPLCLYIDRKFERRPKSSSEIWKLSTQLPSRWIPAPSLPHRITGP